MVDLVAKTPCDGLLPVTVGSVSLTETDAGVLTSLSVYNGKTAQLSEALSKAHGAALPSAGQSTLSETARVIWFGRAMALLAGPPPDASLSRHAALTDQSDAWAVVSLSGADAADVLARLVPVDLRFSEFAENQTIRSQIMHMNASITRTGSDSFLIMVFRAMAHTLVHELKTAMEGVAARR